MSLAEKLQTVIGKVDFWFGLKFRRARISYDRGLEAIVVTKGYYRQSDIIEFANAHG